MDLRFVPFLNIIIHRENPISTNLNEGEIRNENMPMLDTGRAKGNWNIGLSNIDYTVNENATSSVKGQAGYENLPREGAGNKVIYITNNLPYINVLENGSSKQAPNGMVSLTMQDVQRSIRNVIR